MPTRPAVLPPFAALAPDSLVVATDIGENIVTAADYYRERRPNMISVHCNIGDMPFLADGVADYVNCDQVIHHTADPAATFSQLVRITRPGCQLTCYVYRRKALPRELLDDHFRRYSMDLSHADLLALSEQLTTLGKQLDELDITLDFPDIPALSIKGGRQSLQRFIYWNFIKCYWNPELGWNASVQCNYDWYSPSQAERYSEDEFRTWLQHHGLLVEHFHKEEACFSGRFVRPQA